MSNITVTMPIEEYEELNNMKELFKKEYDRIIRKLLKHADRGKGGVYFIKNEHALAEDNEEVEMLHSDYTYKIVKAKAKAEAIKEFAERLKIVSGSVVAVRDGRELYETKAYTINALKLDNLVKEMVGDE